MGNTVSTFGGPYEVWTATTSAAADVVMTSAGTLSNFTAADSVEEDAGHAPWTFTVYKNDVATSITCSIAAATTTCTDTTHTVAFAVGDKLSVLVTNTNKVDTAHAAVVGWRANYG